MQCNTIMISPTGKGTIRNDAMGHGGYGSKRGSRIHKGTDYLCDPGQDIVAPISGFVVRVAKPYANEKYSGVVMKNGAMQIKMFYFEPYSDLIGNSVQQGDFVGLAQDASEKHGPTMRPHVHLEIDHIDPDIFINGIPNLFFNS